MPPVERDVTFDPVSVSQIFELLSDTNRRWILRYLAEHPHEQVSVDELVDYLSRECPATESGNLDIALIHNHLPKLADLGVVEYDSALDSVNYQPHSEIEAVLTFVGTDE